MQLNQAMWNSMPPIIDIACDLWTCSDVMWTHHRIILQTAISSDCSHDSLGLIIFCPVLSLTAHILKQGPSCLCQDTLNILSLTPHGQAPRFLLFQSLSNKQFFVQKSCSYSRIPKNCQHASFLGTYTAFASTMCIMRSAPVAKQIVWLYRAL